MHLHAGVNFKEIFHCIFCFVNLGKAFYKRRRKYSYSILVICFLVMLASSHCKVVINASFCTLECLEKRKRAQYKTREIGLCYIATCGPKICWELIRVEQTNIFRLFILHFICCIGDFNSLYHYFY